MKKSLIPSYWRDDQSAKDTEGRWDLSTSRRIIRPPGKPAIRVSRMFNMFQSLGDPGRRRKMLHWMYAMLYVEGFGPKDKPPGWVCIRLNQAAARLQAELRVDGVGAAFTRILRFAIRHQQEIADGEIEPKHCVDSLLAILQSVGGEKTSRMEQTRASEQQRLARGRLEY